MAFVTLAEFQTRYENTVPAADVARVGALLDDACALAVDITGTTYAVHKVADSTTIAATKPAVTEANDFALCIELMGDHNTHTASTVFHVAATAPVSSVAATSEETLVAQLNLYRMAQLAHYADTVAHGGMVDAANLAIVAATSPCTNSATAHTMVNVLYPAHVAHLLVIIGAIISPAVPGAITATVCTAVRRAYENPMGLGGETIGDYSWRVSATNSGVYFAPAEEAIIRRAAGKSGVGTLELQGMLPDSIGAGIGAYVTVDGVSYWQSYP